MGHHSHQTFCALAQLDSWPDIMGVIVQTRLCRLPGNGISYDAQGLLAVLMYTYYSQRSQCRAVAAGQPKGGMGGAGVVGGAMHRMLHFLTAV